MLRVPLHTNLPWPRFYCCVLTTKDPIFTNHLTTVYTHTHTPFPMRVHNQIQLFQWSLYMGWVLTLTPTHSCTWAGQRYYRARHTLISERTHHIEKFRETASTPWIIKIRGQMSCTSYGVHSECLHLLLGLRYWRHWTQSVGQDADSSRELVYSVGSYDKKKQTKKKDGNLHSCIRMFQTPQTTVSLSFKCKHTRRPSWVQLDYWVKMQIPPCG